MTNLVEASLLHIRDIDYAYMIVVHHCDNMARSGRKSVTIAFRFREEQPSAQQFALFVDRVKRMARGEQQGVRVSYRLL